MGIQITTGIASGIDYEEIIDATLSVEQVFIDNLETKKEAYESNISAYGTIKSALLSFENALADLAEADDFFTVSASSSNEDILSVSASEDASSGTYQVEVKQLAAPEILIGYDGFTSADDVVGTGTISITIGSQDSVEIEIDDEHDTLQGIANAINDSDAGVSASVIETNEGQYALSLTATEFGEDINFSVTDDGDEDVSDDTGLSRLYSDPALSEMETVQDGTTALISYGNREIERSSNVIDGLIDGITIDLNLAREDSWVTIQVERNDTGITDKIQALVDSYNACLDYFALYQDNDDEESVGVLLGDTTMIRLKSDLQQSIFTRIDTGNSSINTLSDLGVEMNDDGTLTFDLSEFSDVLDDDETAVVEFFTNKENGWSAQLSDWMEGYTESDGILDSKTDGYETSIERIDNRIEEKEADLVTMEDRLWLYYNTLESALSELQNTQSSIAALLEGFENA